MGKVFWDCAKTTKQPKKQTSMSSLQSTSFVSILQFAPTFLLFSSFLLPHLHISNSEIPTVAQMTFYFPPLLLSLLLLSTLPSKSSSQSQPFKCSSSSTCHSLIDYIPPNSTTLTQLKTLFTVKNIRSILGANNYPSSTPANLTIPAKQPIKIPFPCVCVNNTGHSNKLPIYTVQKDDGLYHIAAEVFSGLVTYQEIAAANNITDANLINVGQKLLIPLPCSCDDVDGIKVVHYGHVVANGSSLDLIAQEYGTSRDTLMKLNGIANDSSLMAGQVLDVPLQACNSSVRTDSIDYPLLVPNGTYFFTANNCVRCNCDSNWTLKCVPSGLKPSNWSTCPAMQCEGAANDLLYLGNTTTSTCNITTCAYAGFSKNQTIYTTLASQSTCPVSSAPSGTPGNNASRTGSSLYWLFISTHLILLLVYFL